MGTISESHGLSGEQFGKIEQLYLSIVTERVSLGYCKEDVVFPAW